MTIIAEASELNTAWKQIILHILKETNLELFLQVEDDKYKTMLPTYPAKNSIFRCFQYFNPEDTKVVILGQDPYHGPNQAMGLSFGVEETIPIPPSLRNITKKLIEEYSNIKTSTTLEHWAKQGVLMLNTALTVRHKTPLSHMKEWLPFTKAIIKHLKENYKNIVFVAWGAFAHKILADIGENHHLIVSSHPSPLSVSRKYKEYSSFKESTPFQSINKLLAEDIEW